MLPSSPWMLLIICFDTIFRINGTTAMVTDHSELSFFDQQHLCSPLPGHWSKGTTRNEHVTTDTVIALNDPCKNRGCG